MEVHFHESFRESFYGSYFLFIHWKNKWTFRGFVHDSYCHGAVNRSCVPGSFRRRDGSFHRNSSASTCQKASMGAAGMSMCKTSEVL